MNDLKQQITDAFRRDDAGEVRRLLTAHPEIREHINDSAGDFGSRVVSGVRSRAMLDVLLEAGADINAKSDWWAGGFGILHCVDPDLCRYAIERGASVDVHAAARLGLLDRLQAMVDANPELVHARGGDGQTPLHFASTVEIAAYLLDRGADIDALDVDHESTPAQYMTGDRHDVARFLISRGCKTDLLMASAVGDLDLVLRTLDADPDSIHMRVTDEYFPMVGGKTGGTIYQWTFGWYVSALDVARKFGHADVLEVLVERSPAAVLLLDACWRGDEAAVREIRESGPPIELREGERRHVAHAARNNDLEAVRLLLEIGLPVDATGQHRATALHWAAFHGNSELIKLLLEHGAPLEALDADFNGTPLHWAIYGSEHGWHRDSGDYAGTVETLIEAGAKRPDSISGTGAVQEVLRRYV